MLTNQGHWITFPFDPNDYVGFTYRITCMDTQKFYVGKKLLWRTKKLPPLKGKKNKRHSKVPSDWETYTSSSREMNESIDKYGDYAHTFEITGLYKTKFDLGMAEFKEIAEVMYDPKNINYYIGFKGSIQKDKTK